METLEHCIVAAVNYFGPISRKQISAKVTAFTIPFTEAQLNKAIENLIAKGIIRKAVGFDHDHYFVLNK